MEAWVSEAVERGGRLVWGGQRQGVFYDATFVKNVPDDAALSSQEAFGPVATMEPFKTFEQAC